VAKNNFPKGVSFTCETKLLDGEGAGGKCCKLAIATCNARSGGLKKGTNVSDRSHARRIQTHMSVSCSRGMTLLCGGYGSS
jgi:hypothetical protein